MPNVFAELEKVRATLETHYRDMQDIEFTVQQSKLYMLQTRNGKRTAPAALKIAVDMANDGLITREEAIRRIEPMSLDQLLHPTLDPKAPKNVLARGLPASPGAASGAVVFSADEAETRAQKGEAVILVRIETSPEDIHGMHAARGILTTRGGMTSHAAVVARGMGRACVAGAGDLRVDYATQTISAKGQVVKAGEMITINGSTGEVMVGEVPTIQPELSGDFGTLMEWADKVRKMGVRANADTPTDAKNARRFGAEGIGLCRTEHMFFEGNRITAVREMIMADDADRPEESARQAAADAARRFRGVVPHHGGAAGDDPAARSAAARIPAQDRCRDERGRESDRQGHADAPCPRRGAARSQSDARPSRLPLGITAPEIYEMQARAIFEAAANVVKETGAKLVPEIMIPLIATKKELDLLKTMVDRVAAEVMKAKGVKFDYLTGTMIELPRAALRAGEIAETAEFFSFGTNDLTQTCFGLSRDDAGSFLGDYLKQGLIDHDPFVSIDREGVGELMKIATERGRRTRGKLKLGICGEHGGDPASVRFCQELGLDYVSCSPYRVPIARLAAAQAALDKEFVATTA